jgi:hypothetical protein
MLEVDLKPEAPEVSELDRVLIAFGAIGHGRLFCTCGYLIWSCPCTKDCNFIPRMIETDHMLCEEARKKLEAEKAKREAAAKAK